MKISIFTLFPDMFDGFLSNSIIKRAIAKGKVEIKIINIRDYTKDPYGRVDTPPIGGGAGLIMKAQPIVDSLNANTTNKTFKLLMSPRGGVYNQKKAQELALKEDIAIICGHYEGIDERVNDYIDELVSIGDYILTGGELASMAISDSIIRLLDGVIAKESLEEESQTDNLLEYPQYTEPREYNSKKVPDILYTGNHEAIKKYRRKESIRLTRKLRPDLYASFVPNKTDTKLIKELDNNENEPKWYKDALLKGKKFLD